MGSMKYYLVLALLSSLIPVAHADDRPISQIYDGSAVVGQANRYPLLIGLDRSLKKIVFQCSGTFISKTRILTARHCVGATRSISAEKRLRLYQGTTFIKIKKVYRSTSDDLAILKVSTQESANPIQVLTSAAPAAEDEVRVLGYGLDEDQKAAVERSAVKGVLSLELLNSALKRADMVVQLVDSLKISFLKKVALFVVVVNNGDGKPCPGDSGGPLIVDHDGTEVVAGALSWGETKKGSPLCSADGRAGYVSLSPSRVSSFLKSSAPDAEYL